MINIGIFKTMAAEGIYAVQKQNDLLCFLSTHDSMKVEWLQQSHKQCRPPINNSNPKAKCSLHRVLILN